MSDFIKKSSHQFQIWPSVFNVFVMLLLLCFVHVTIIPLINPLVYILCVFIHGIYPKSCYR